MALSAPAKNVAYWLLLSLIWSTAQLHAQTCGPSAAHDNNLGRTTMEARQNVLGGTLTQCGCSPMTGFFRDGFCRTDDRDFGSHTVCAIVTEDFLKFTRSRGNDLSSPAPQYGFPGLKAGDRWCLCVKRWKEAFDAGMAPSVVLEATDKAALNVVTLDELLQHAVQ